MSRFRIVIEGETHDMNSVRSLHNDAVARLKGQSTGLTETLVEVAPPAPAEGRGEGKHLGRSEGKGAGKGEGKGTSDAV